MQTHHILAKRLLSVFKVLTLGFLFPWFLIIITFLDFGKGTLYERTSIDQISSLGKPFLFIILPILSYLMYKKERYFWSILISSVGLITLIFFIIQSFVNNTFPAFF